MATFETLRHQVIKIHNCTGDAISELEYKIDRANAAVDGWAACLSNTSDTKQRRQREKVYVTSQRRVKHLTELLSVARTIICEDCGNIITESHDEVWVGGGWVEPGEWECASGEMIIPF